MIKFNRFAASLVVAVLTFVLIAGIALAGRRVVPSTLTQRDLYGWTAPVDTANSGWTLGGLNAAGTGANVDTFVALPTADMDWIATGFGRDSSSTYTAAYLNITTLGGVVAATYDTMFAAFDASSDNVHWTVGSFTTTLIPSGATCVRVPISFSPRDGNSLYMSAYVRARLRGDGNLSSWPKGKAVFGRYNYNQ